MGESLVLAVDIGHEMLRSFRQIEDSLEIDYFGCRSRSVGKALGEDFKHASVGYEAGASEFLHCETGITIFSRQS